MSYIRHALSANLIPTTHFFNTLCDVACPSSPIQFAAFLQLVTEFIPQLGAKDEKDPLVPNNKILNGTKQNAETISPQTLQLLISISKETKKENNDVKEMDMGCGTSHKGEQTNVISYLSRTFLRIELMLISGIEFCLPASKNIQTVER